MISLKSNNNICKHALCKKNVFCLADSGGLEFTATEMA